MTLILSHSQISALLDRDQIAPSQPFGVVTQHRPAEYAAACSHDHYAMACEIN